MALDLIVGLGHGADKNSVVENAGSTDPQVVSATATSTSTIAVTFNQNMAFIGDGAVLHPNKWSIVTQIGGVPLPVLWTEKQSDTVVVLHTPNQAAVTYDLVVVDVVDVYLQPIDTANDDASFLGIAPTFPTVTSVTSFIGLDHGLQAEDQPDWEPDVVPPYVDNEDPAPSAPGVAKEKIIEFDLLDAGDGVDLTTVVITVEGATAYTGATDLFSAPYNDTGSVRTPVVGPPAGHHFAIEKTSDWESVKTIAVRVVAEDVNGSPLDVTWDFDIEDWDAPDLFNASPTGSGVSKTAPVSFDLHDDTGVNQATLDVTIEGGAVITGGVFQGSWTGSIVANGFNGFDVSINAPAANWDSYGAIAVIIGVDDNDANHADFNWSFNVEDYVGPHIIPVSPTAGELEVGNTTHITIRFQDENEVVLATMKVYVDIGGAGFELAYEGGGSPDFKSGWDGASSALTGPSNNRLLVIDRVGLMPNNEVITVWVFAQDPDGNLERL